MVRIESCDDEMMRVFLRYYSHRINGIETICIVNDNDEFVVIDGGLTMMKFDKDEIGRVARLCIEMAIVIRPFV